MPRNSGTISSPFETSSPVLRSCLKAIHLWGGHLEKLAESMLALQIWQESRPGGVGPQGRQGKPRKGENAGEVQRALPGERPLCCPVLCQQHDHVPDAVCKQSRTIQTTDRSEILGWDAHVLPKSTGDVLPTHSLRSWGCHPQCSS